MEQVIKYGAPLLEFYSFCIEAPELNNVLIKVSDEYLAQGEEMLTRQHLLHPQDIFRLEQQLQHLGDPKEMEQSGEIMKRVATWLVTLSQKDQKNLILLWALCRYEEFNDAPVSS